MEAIVIQDLGKVYRNGTPALDGLSLTVKEGEIFTLLGPNGAGKSTLINILTTYLSPTSGSAVVLGRDVTADPALVRKQIACVAQKNTIDHHMTLEENLRFQAGLYGLGRSDTRAAIDRLVDLFGLSEYAGRRVAFFSGGIRRRLDIAMSLVARPRLLFLDEPTVALDVASRQAVWRMIRQIRDEGHTTVFMTTHYLEEAEHLSDTICILKEGRRIVQDTPQNLRRYTRQTVVNVTLTSSETVPRLERLLRDQPYVRSIRLKENHGAVVVTDGLDNLAAITGLLLEHSLPFQSVGLAAPSLESVFLALTKAG